MTSEFKQVEVGQMWLGEPNYPWETLLAILQVGPVDVRVRNIRTQEEFYILRHRFEGCDRYIVKPEGV